MVLGSVEILEGGSYMFEGKKFVFDKSHIYFTGNPNKPLLEASVKYKSFNHLITIRLQVQQIHQTSIFHLYPL